MLSAHNYDCDSIKLKQTHWFALLLSTFLWLQFSRLHECKQQTKIHNMFANLTHAPIHTQWLCLNITNSFLFTIPLFCIMIWVSEMRYFFIPNSFQLVLLFINYVEHEIQLKDKESSEYCTCTSLLTVTLQLATSIYF